MKITIASTSTIVDVNGTPARIWEGTTETGIAVHAIIATIAVHEDDDCNQFEAELRECQPLSAAAARVYDTKLLLP